MRYGKLNPDKTITPLDDVIEWAKWFENFKERQIEQTIIGDVSISTVFLGINHSFYDDGELWFETMIFGGPHDGYEDRSATYNGALEMHERAVNIVKGLEHE